MRLADLALTPKKILLGLAFLAIIIVLLIVISLKIIKPKEVIKPPAVPEQISSPVINLPPQVDSTPLRNITFNLGTPNLPHEAPVYKISGSAINQQQAGSIANTFSITTSPRITRGANGHTTLIWQNKNIKKTLTITLETGQIEYIHTAQYAKPDIGSAPLPTITEPVQAANAAQDFLKDHTLNRHDIFVENAQFIKGGEEIEYTDNLAEARSIKVNYGRKIQNTPVYYQFGNTSPISVWVDKLRTPIKISYQYSGIAKDSSRNFTLVNLEDAKTKLINGEGEIVNFTPGIDDPKNNKKLISANLTSVEFAYFDDGSTGYLQPIFVFKGEATYENVGEQDIVVYLPAIKT